MDLMAAYYMADETSGLNDLADEEGFFVAYPQAAYRPAKNATYWEPGFNGGRTCRWDDIHFTERLINHIDEEFSIDLSRVYGLRIQQRVECSHTVWLV